MKNITDLVGKTIQSIDSEATNAWVIRFTDGTHTIVWAEIGGSPILPYLYLDDDLRGFDAVTTV